MTRGVPCPPAPTPRRARSEYLVIEFRPGHPTGENLPLVVDLVDRKTVTTTWRSAPSGLGRHLGCARDAPRARSAVPRRPRVAHHGPQRSHRANRPSSPNEGDKRRPGYSDPDGLCESVTPSDENAKSDARPCRADGGSSALGTRGRLPPLIWQG